MSNDIKQSSPFEEEESSFDIMKWVHLVLQYWYLFVISILGALAFTYLANRKWTPTYKVTARVIVEDNSKISGPAAMMQGFDIQSGYRNVNNQIIMFGSYDLIAKAVEILKLDVDYYTRGRFKTRNLYKVSPIEVTYDFLDPTIYSMELEFTSLDENSFEISYEGDKRIPAFTHTGTYGVPLKTSMFFMTVNKTPNFHQNATCYFQFRTKDSWIYDFNSRITFNFVMKGASVVEVALIGKVVERDRDFINALCNAFLNDNLNRKNDAATKTITFIDEQLSGIADSLNIAETNLRTFRTQNQMNDISSYSATLLSQLDNYDQKRVELNLKKTYLDYLSDYLKGNIEDGKIVAPSSLGVMDPMLMAQVAELTELQIKQDEMGEKSPYYQRYQTQIDLKKQTLFEVLNNMYAGFKIEQDNFNKEYNNLLSKMNTLPAKESEMINYQRIYKIHDNYYTFLMQKKAEAQIQKASNSPDNIILEVARPQGITNSGVKTKKLTQNLIIGLLLPLLFIFLKEFLNTTIRDKNDIKKITKFDVIGTIQKGQHTKNPLLVLKNPKSLFSEGFRLIRTRLEFITKSHENNSAIILVTSAESGDGKSFYCINQAGIYAMEKKKTLLIDLDLRKPSIGASLSVNNPKGVSNYLIGQVDMEDIIIKDSEYPFDIILPGTIPPNPGELIKSERLKDMLQKLRKKYEYIIVDTSPIGLVGDAYALTSFSDVNLFVVRQEKTNKSFFKNVIEQIKEDKVPNVYIVLNGADTKKNEYSTYHGYMRKMYTRSLGSEYHEYYES